MIICNPPYRNIADPSVGIIGLRVRGSISTLIVQPNKLLKQLLITVALFHKDRLIIAGGVAVGINRNVKLRYLIVESSFSKFPYGIRNLLD
ncbi:hypothetical protein D3C71_2066810 [compost metagenome]